MQARITYPPNSKSGGSSSGRITDTPRRVSGFAGTKNRNLSQVRPRARRALGSCRPHTEPIVAARFFWRQLGGTPLSPARELPLRRFQLAAMERGGVRAPVTSL